MARKLVVEIVGDASSLERSFARANKSAKGFGRDIGKAGRGAAVATVGFHGLGRAVGSASAAFLGGAGLVVGIKSTVEAALESQRVLAQTRNAVQNTGQSWGKYAKQIDATLQAQSNLSAFDDEELSGTFSNLVRSTGDVNEALRLNALAANVARGRNTDLQSAQQLVLKASIGQIGALRRVGINLDKNATATEALDLLQRKFAGSAAAYGRTAAGSIDRFRVAIENAQESIGKALLPTIAKLSTQLADFLNKPSTQQGLENFGDRVSKAGGFVAKTAGLLERLNKNAERFDKSVVLALESPLRIIPRVNDHFESLRDSLRDTTAAADAMGLAFNSALKEGLSLKAIQGTAPGRAAAAAAAAAGGIPGSVSGTAARVLRAAPPTADTPFLALQLARAEATKTRKDDEKVLKQIIGVLSGRLGTVNLKARTELQQTINQLSDQLTGLREEDAQVIKDAADRAKDRRDRARQGALDALRSLHDTLQKDADNRIKAAAALVDQADKIKSAILNRLQGKQTDVLNKRALSDAQAQLALARTLGGASGIREATRGVEDAKFAIFEQRLSRTPARLTSGGQLSFGPVTINVNGDPNPDVTARRVMQEFKRLGRHTSAPTRGSAAGIPHGI